MLWFWRGDIQQSDIPSPSCVEKAILRIPNVCTLANVMQESCLLSALQVELWRSSDNE